MTKVPGVFSAGDVETGPDIAIRACAGGRKAAQGIISLSKAKRQGKLKRKRCNTKIKAAMS